MNDVNNATKHPEATRARSADCDMPDAVRQALHERQVTTTAPVDGCGGAADVVAVGDLRVAAAVAGQPTDPKIVLVVGVDKNNEYVDAMFVHSAPENAAEYDVVVSPGNSEAAYDTVVQTDLRTVLWCSQLGTRIGNISGVLVDTIVATSSTRSSRRTTQSQHTCRHGDRNDPSGMRCGTPLCGSNDRRWEFKETEGAAARRLANDCVATLLGRGETS